MITESYAWDFITPETRAFLVTFAKMPAAVRQTLWARLRRAERYQLLAAAAAIAFEWEVVEAALRVDAESPGGKISCQDPGRVVPGPPPQPVDGGTKPATPSAER